MDFKLLKFKYKNLLGIFKEGIKYTCKMAFWHWMGISMLGNAISKLYNVNFFYYDNCPIKRTSFNRPNDEHTCDKAVFPPIMAEDRDGPLKVVRFYYTTTNDDETGWNHLK